MSKPDRRRITLFDVMTLIAATAFGLALIQLAWPRNSATPVPSGSVGMFALVSNSYPSVGWMFPAAKRAAVVLPCLAAWTGAFLASRLHGPRPRRKRLIIQPGFVGAVAALSVLLIESILLVGSAQIDGRFRGLSPTRIAEFATNGFILLAHHAGWAVGVSWLTLALIGRWRAEPSWVDRWGRVLGCTWIAVGPLASLLIDQTPWWGNFLSP